MLRLGLKMTLRLTMLRLLLHPRLEQNAEASLQLEAPDLKRKTATTERADVELNPQVMRRS